MKFVIAAYGSRGDTEPCIAVAGELQRRGHDVRMAVTVPPDLSAYVASQGLSTVAYGRDWQELLSDEDFTRMLENPVNAIPQATDYVAQVVAEKSATLLSLADGADLIVAGLTEQTPAGNVAEYYGIPLAALHFFPAQVLRREPAQNATTTQSDRAQRQALGLPEEPSTALQPLEIQAYDEICVPGAAVGWADSAERRPFVGALTLQLPTAGDDEVLSWIAGGSPPVYFGFGSMPVSSPAEMVAVIGAACAEIDVRALICLGANIFDDISVQENVKLVHEANHASVFPSCRAVVHHGGAGTTAAGLRAGVPALVLWNGLDQPVWATSIALLQVGAERCFADSTLNSLIADLRAVLDPKYAVRAREVAGLMSKPDESLTRAVDLIEAAAARGRRS